MGTCSGVVEAEEIGAVAFAETSPAAAVSVAPDTDDAGFEKETAAHIVAKGSSSGVAAAAAAVESAAQGRATAQMAASPRTSWQRPHET